MLDILGHEMAVQTTRVDLTGDVVPVMDVQFSEKHKVLKLRLAPLRSIQTDLERKLGSGAFEDYGQLNNNGRGRTQSASAISSTSSSTEFSPIDRDNQQIQRLPKEFYIRSNNSWKDRLKHGLKNVSRPYSGGSLHNAFKSWGSSEKIHSSEWGKDDTDLEEIASIISGCKEDIKALWEDEVVQKVLSKRKHRVDESSGLCVLRSLNNFTGED